MHSRDMKAPRQRFKQLFGALVLMFGVTVAPYSLANEISPQIANCEELKEVDIQAQIDLCTAHAGCNLILESKKSCAAAKTFLDKLKAAVGAGTKTFFSYSKKVTSNHVFEASLSDAAKAVEQLPAVRQILEGTWWNASKETRDQMIGKYGVHALGLLARVDAAGKTVLELSYGSSGKAVWVGDTHGTFLTYNDKDYRHGYGVLFFDDGEIHRGKSFDSKISGEADFLRPNGLRRVGYADDNRPHKDFDQVIVYPSGEVYQGRVDANVRRSGKGVLMWPNGKIKEEGIFEKEKLTLGKRYSEEGSLVAEVDKPVTKAEQVAIMPTASGSTATIPSQRSSTTPGSPDYQPSRPSTSAASGSAGTAPRAITVGRSCQDILNGLIGPVNDAAASSRLTLAQSAQEVVWAMQTYMRVANAHSACANDAQSRQQVASMLRKEQDRCRQGGFSNCDSGQNFSGTAARTEMAIRQLFQESSAQSGNAAQAQVGGECQAALNRQEKEFAPTVKRIENTKSVVEQSQLTLGMINQQMALLDKLCKGQPQYGVYASLKQSYDGTMRACRGVASNPGDCVPRSSLTGISQTKACSSEIERAMSAGVALDREWKTSSQEAQVRTETKWWLEARCPSLESMQQALEINERALNKYNYSNSLSDQFSLARVQMGLCFSREMLGRCSSVKPAPSPALSSGGASPASQSIKKGGSSSGCSAARVSGECDCPKGKHMVNGQCRAGVAQ